MFLILLKRYIIPTTVEGWIFLGSIIVIGIIIMLISQGIRTSELNGFKNDAKNSLLEGDNLKAGRSYRSLISKCLGLGEYGKVSFSVMAHNIDHYGLEAVEDFFKLVPKTMKNERLKMEWVKLMTEVRSASQDKTYDGSNGITFKGIALRKEFIKKGDDLIKRLPKPK